MTNDTVPLDDEGLDRIGGAFCTYILIISSILVGL
jgi:hypothetical protein